MMDLHWFTPHQMMISIALTFFYADEDITSNVMNVQEMLNEKQAELSLRGLIDFYLIA